MVVVGWLGKEGEGDGEGEGINGHIYTAFWCRDDVGICVHMH